MTGTLTYDLPDEEAAFKAASQALDWVETVRELDTWLRNGIKHGDGSDYTTTHDALCACRDKLHEIVDENGLRLLD